MPRGRKAVRLFDMKWCPRCESYQMPAEFYYYPNRPGDGLSAYCKPCTSAASREQYERVKGTERKKRQVNEHSRRYALKAKYGLTVEARDRLVLAARGRCMICGDKPADGKTLSIDHSHKTRKVRGVLCTRCNFGIGYFLDSPELLASAIEYLGRFAHVGERG
jgi:hypothetical protein